MKLFVLLFAVCIVTSFQVCGQDSLLKNLYQREAIWLDYPYYWKNGVKYHVNKLRQDFELSERGKVELEAGFKDVKVSRYLLVASSATLIGSFFTINNNKNATYGLLAGTIVLNIIGIKFSLRGRRHIQKAIFYRNQDLLFPHRN